MIIPENVKIGLILMLIGLCMFLFAELLKYWVLYGTK
jgi:hypothetical protein